MATAVQPTLGGTTLPHVSAWRISNRLRGSGTQMADGTLQWSLVNASNKTVHVLEWNKLSQADYNTVLAKWTNIGDTSATLGTPNGDSHTVLRDPENPTLEAETFIDASTEIYFRVSMALFEV